MKTNSETNLKDKTIAMTENCTKQCVSNNYTMIAYVDPVKYVSPMQSDDEEAPSSNVVLPGGHMKHSTILCRS